MPGRRATDAGYQAAFLAAGLNLDDQNVAQAAALLWKRSPGVVVELASYLDHWSSVRLQARRPLADRRKILEVSRAIDSDVYRDRIRTLMTAEGIKDRVGELKALAEDPRSADLPAPTAVLLADALSRPEDRVALLRKVVERHPDDVWINFTLARALDGIRPTPVAEVVRYYSAARALRPETSHELAHVLEKVDRYDEAEATFRDLAARRPDNARNLACLGKQLQNRGFQRPDECVLQSRGNTTLGAGGPERSQQSARPSRRDGPGERSPCTLTKP